ncbi:hypothetical protein SADUNF_Sadunf06G0197300 [Salix dunnii]|uniref:Uncharacterized protein n=1 Tax=Salix dunnii TaxID=1413687 RepID=A0A835K881_9ROSI|nr:hypothetical protein SADUNF_Sadunf06G0197300 [Salix dunnii]
MRSASFEILLSMFMWIEDTLVREVEKLPLLELVNPSDNRLTRRTLGRTGGLFYILVVLEVQTMNIDMGGVKDLV